MEGSSQRSPLLRPAAGPGRTDVHEGDGTKRHVLIHLKPCIAELIGTMIYVFVGTASYNTQDSFQIAAAHGLSIAMLVDQFVDISGGHFNPAVTIGVVLGNGSMHWFQAIFYIMAQLTGATIGAGMMKVIFTFPSSTNPEKTHYEVIRGGCHGLAKNLTPMQAIVCEAVLTFVLVQTVLLLVVDKTVTKHNASLAIGFAVFVGISSAYGVTGGSLNPARSFGPAIVFLGTGTSPLKNLYVYWIGPIAGSLIAVLIYRLVFGEPNQTLWHIFFGSNSHSRSPGDQA